MGKIKGQKEYEKFTSGRVLTRKQAMLAQCYSCNGFEDSSTDCQGESCPLYQFSPYKGIKKGEVVEDSRLNKESLTLKLKMVFFSYIKLKKKRRRDGKGKQSLD